MAELPDTPKVQRSKSRTPGSARGAGGNSCSYRDKLMPVELLGFDTDNDTVFMNETVRRRVAWMHKIVTEKIQPKQHVSLRMTLRRSLV